VAGRALLTGADLSCVRTVEKPVRLLDGGKAAKSPHAAEEER